MSFGTPGFLDSLVFEPDYEVANPLEAHDVKVDVVFSGLNFRDCLAALGQIDPTVSVGNVQESLPEWDRIYRVSTSATGLLFWDRYSRSKRCLDATNHTYPESRNLLLSLRLLLSQSCTPLHTMLLLR